MAYMKRNVNLLLMILLLVVLLSMVILTTFYQSTYRNLTISYDEKTSALTELSQNFSSKLTELNRTTTQLQISSGDKQQLDSLYQQLETDRNKLTVDLSSTKTRLSDTQNSLDTTEAELLDAKDQIFDQGEEIVLLNDQVSRQKKIIRDYRDDVCALNKQIDSAYVC